MITITPLKADTIPIFTRLYSSFWRDYRRKQGIKRVNLKEYVVEAREIAQKMEHIVYLAFYDQNPAGFIHIHEIEGVYWIKEIYTEPKYRRKGIALELVKFAEKEILKRGGTNLYLMVTPWDKQAINFWRKAGYTLLNTIELTKTLKEERENDVVEIIGDLWDIYEVKNTSSFKPVELMLMEALKDVKNAGIEKEKILKFLLWSMMYLLDSSKKNKESSEYDRFIKIMEHAEGRALDVGSGQGELVFLLQRSNKIQEIFALEKNEIYFRWCQRVSKRLGIKNIHFLNADFLKWESKRRFDTIIFSYILHDLEEIDEFLDKAFEILNESGKILISDIDLNNLKAKLTLWADSRNVKISIEEGARIISHGTETKWFFGKIGK